MKKNQCFLKTFLIIFAFSIIAPAAIAQNTYQNNYPIVSYLLDYAKKLYEQGDVENAKHEFSKLLIIDPDNIEAREYLKKMGLDRGLYRSTGRLGLQEGSIYNENLGLREQNKQLQEAVKNLRQELGLKAGQIRALEEALKKEGQDTTSRLSEYGDKVSVLENLLAAKDQALANLHEALRAQRLEGDMHLTERERRLNTELSNSDALNARLQEYARRTEELEHNLSSKERELAQLNAELESYRKESQEWQFIKQNELQDKAYALEKLKNEFDALQQKLTQAENEILEKDLRLAEFEARISDLKNALQDKEIEITGLGQSIASQKQEWEDRLNAKDEELAKQYSVTEEQRKKIEGLNSELASVSVQLDQSAEVDRQKDARLADFEDKLNALRDALQAKEFDIAELNQGLESQKKDWEGRLSEKDRELADRERSYTESVSGLNNELASVSSQLNQAERNNQEKDAKLAGLQERLSALKQSLQAKEIEVAGLSREFSSQKEDLDSRLQQKDSEISGILSELSVVKGDLMRIEADNLNKEEQIRQLEGIKVKLQQGEDSLLKELEVKKAQLNELMQNTDSLRDVLQEQEFEISSLKKEFDLEQQAAERRLAEKENELTGKYADIEGLNMRLQEAKGNLVRAEKEKLDKESWIEQLQGKIKNLEDASSDQLTKYLEKLNSLEDSIKAKDTQITNLNKDFESRSRQLQEQLSAREEELAAKTAELETSNQQLASKGTQLARREKDNQIQAAEVSRLQDKIKQVETESSKLLGEYLDKLNGLNDSLKAKAEELSSLSRDFDSHKQQLAEQLSEKDEQLAQQSSKISQLDKELDAARGYLVEAETANADKSRQIKEFEIKLQDASSAAAAESEQNKNLIAGLKGQVNEKEQALAGLNTELDSAKKDFSGFLSAKDQELAQKNSEIDKLNTRLKEYENTLKNLETSLFEKQKQEADLQAQLGSSGQEHAATLSAKEEELAQKSSEIDGLRKKIQEYEGSIADLGKSVSDKEQEFSALDAQFKSEKEQYEAKLSAKEEELAQKSSEIGQLSSQIAQLSDKLAAAEEALSGKSQASSELESALDSQKQEFSAQLSAKEEELAGQALKINELNNKLKEYQDRVSALVNSLTGKEQEMNDLKAGLESAKEELSRQLSAKEEQLSQGAAKTEELNKQLDEYKNLLSTSENFLGVKDQALTDLNNQFESLKAQLQGQLAARDGELKEKDAKIEDLNNQLDLAMEQLAQAEARKAETESKAAQLEQKIKEQEAALGGQIAEYEDKLNNLKDSISAKENELQDTSRKVEELLRQKEELEAEANQQILSLQATMDKLQQSLSSEIDDYKAKLEMAGRGIVVTVLTDIAFDSGKADILPAGTKILDKISKVLGEINPDNHIVIEGYTDNTPIRYSGWESNWELSTARALSVLHYLIDTGGLSPERFSANGYGEYRPVADNNTELGKRQNRRVEIVIQPPKIIKVKSEVTPSAEDNIGTGTQVPAAERISF